MTSCTFTDLKNFGNKLVQLAHEWKLPFQLYFYSSKIGRYVRVHEFHKMNMQTKYVILFKGSAFDDMQVAINAFSPLGKDTLDKNKDSIQRNTLYGRDVYQNVATYTLYQENASSSKKYDADELKAEGLRMVKAQEKAFLKQEDLDEASLQQNLELIKQHLDKAYIYLSDVNGRFVTIKRSSGIANKVKLKPNTGLKNLSFSNILILFGKENKFPVQVLPSKSKGGGNLSISNQYKANPSAFRYYDKFGIFEVYDK